MRIRKESVDKSTGDIKTMYIVVGENEYQIEEDRTGGLRITKSNLHSSSMEIHPCVSNQITIK